MSRHTVTVEIYRTESANRSYYGNPAKIIHTSRGAYRTQTDANFVYGFDNTNWENTKAELTLTPAGRVTNVRKLKPANKGGLRDEIYTYRYGDPDFM